MALKEALGLIISVGGAAGGMAIAVVKILHPYEGGILFLFGFAASCYSIYASRLHIKSIRQKNDGKH